MPEKLGNGGHSNEAYDPNTGRYVAKSAFSNEDIRQALESGKFGEEFKTKFIALDRDSQEKVINNLANKLSEKQTKTDMEGRYDTFSYDDYMAMAKENEKLCNKDDTSAFYGLCGAGSFSFDFNKALRLGFDKFYETYPQYNRTGSMLSKKNIEERAEKLDRITNSFKLPRDCQVQRYLDENYLVSQFGKYLENFDKIPDGYGYQTIDKNKYSVEQLAEALQDAVGNRIASDEGFTSFSTTPKNTHMGKGNYKRIMLRYNCKQGTKCFISTYSYESEGMFPRKTSYYVQDVKVENGRVVIDYGVEQ